MRPARRPSPRRPAAHDRSAIVDWRVQRPENQEPEPFFDMGHYRQPLAAAIEADIAKALADLK